MARIDESSCDSHDSAELMCYTGEEAKKMFKIANIFLKSRVILVISSFQTLLN
jgi:hypothetical protein